MATSDNLFESLYQGYNDAFSSGANASVSTAFSTLSSYMQGALSLYVIVCGVLVMTGSLSFDAGLKRCLRALMVVFILTPAHYNEYLTTTFTQRIPNAISGAVGGSTGVTGASVFDQLLASDEAMLAQVLATAGANVFSIGKIISAYIAMGLAELALLLSFLIWWSASALVFIVLAIGPYLMPLWLFDFTRDVPVRMIGKLIGYMVLMVMVLTMTQIVQGQEKAYVMAFAPVMTTPIHTGINQEQGFLTPEGQWVNTGSNANQVASGGNLDEQVSTLWKVAMAFGFGAALMLLLPSIAAYIGGGVAVSLTPFMMVATRAMSAL